MKTYNWEQCGKFSEAIEGLIKLSPSTRAPKVLRVATESLLLSKRFFIPGELNLVRGKRYDDNLKNYMKLPFSCTSLLTECDITDDNGKFIEKMPTITVAIDLDGAENMQRKWLMTQKYETSFAIITIVKQKKFNIWFPYPVICFCRYPEGKDGRFLSVLKTPENEGLQIDFDRVVRDFQHDANAIENLCLMLSLHNVKSTRISAPEKINKLREKKGKDPLLDYHVLNVNGDIWDGAERNNGRGEGYRSHIRRGHIRRLDENRNIWVSACFVHGRKDGFVNKEYIVNQPTQ